MPPLAILREAIKAVPAVRYALGVGGVVSVVALVFLIEIDITIAAMGTLAMFVLMGILVIFARMTKLNNRILALPAIVFTWFVLLIFISSSSLLFTSIFFKTPLDIRSFILQHYSQAYTDIDGNQVNVAYDYDGETTEHAIGHMFEQGINLPKDKSKAMIWYRKGVESKDPDSMIELAELITQENPTPEEISEADELYFKAAKLGSPRGIYKAGLYYRDNKDYRKAESLLIESGNKGYYPAYAEAGLILENGFLGKEKISDSITWYEKGAENNDPQSLHFLGVVYWEGKIKKIDPARAADLLEKAVEYDGYFEISTVMWLLGNIYNDRKYPTYNPVRAKKMYEMAAKKGHPCSRVALANILLKENPPEVSEAVKLFEEGVSDKQTQVIFPYARRLINGDGLNKDINRAKSLLKAGVDLKDIDSMIMLADAYATGKLGVANALESAKYYSLAAQNGSTDAERRLEKIISGGYACHSN